MLENMAAARQAAYEDPDGVHDYFHGDKWRCFREQRLLDGVFVPLNLGRDGFKFWRQNGFEG